MPIEVWVFLLGAGIGTISALLGLGGGVLIIPLLPLVTPLTHHEVIGTSLFTILLVVTNNTIKFQKNGLVAWRMVLIMGPLTAIFAFISARIGLNLGEQTLKLILVVVYFLMALWTFIKKQSENKEIINHSNKTLIILSLAAILAGSLSGLTGIGSGIILGGFLLNLNAISNAKISPTCNAIMIFTCLFGLLAYAGNTFVIKNYSLGKINLLIAINLFLGALLSSHYARKYQHKIRARHRKWLLASLLVFLGLKVTLTI